MRYVKVTTTHYVDDWALSAAVACILRDGTPPSRVTIKQIRDVAQEWYDSYGGQMSAMDIADLNMDEIDDDDPIWDKIDATLARLGLWEKE